MTNEVITQKAQIDSLINYAKRMHSAAGYLNSRPKKQFTKVTDSEQIKKIYAWMENYNREYVEPFEKLLDTKRTSVWVNLLSLGSSKSFQEVKKLQELKKSMRKAWNERPDFMRAPNAKRRVFKKGIEQVNK